uniref:Uncharacterized protein n=1 Tax=viral metagenome TaxID=1070528 RepID=A0A6C0CVY1_9ZZZZ
MNFVFLLFTTFLLTRQPLRNFHFCKNQKIKSGIDSCSNGDEPCSNNNNNNETCGSIKLKKIIDALLRPQQITPKITIFPKITRECEEGDWESGEIPWDFVDDGNVSIALDPHSIAMLLL